MRLSGENRLELSLWDIGSDLNFVKTAVEDLGKICVWRADACE